MSSKVILFFNLLRYCHSTQDSDTESNLLRGTKFDVSELFAPLRQAAQVVQHFSDDLAARAKAPTSSFLQKSSDDSWMDSPLVSKQFKINTEKTDKSLAEARLNLQKIDKELANEKKILAEQDQKMKAVIGSDKELFTLHQDSAASFLQTHFKLHDFDISKLPGFGGASDPLSPQNLEKWKESFEEKLRKARDIARDGLPADAKASFIQEEHKADDEFNSLWSPQSYVEAQDKIRRGAKEVDRLQEQFKEGMEKLTRENSELMAQSQAELAKYRDMKAKLESSTSFLQEASKATNKHHFMTEDEVRQQDDDLIKKIERRWKNKSKEIIEKTRKQKMFIEKENAELIASANKEREIEHEEMEKMRQSVKADMDRLSKYTEKSKAISRQMEDKLKTVVV